MRPFHGMGSPYRVGGLGGFAAYGAAVSNEWHSLDFPESLRYGAT